MPDVSSAPATRDALLQSARRVFTERGYDAAGVREIAGAAGVNAALVNRYFGSKRGLFAEAVAGRFTIGDLLVGDRQTLGDRIARFLTQKRRRGAFDPTLVLLRSASSPDAGPLLRAAVDAQVVRPLAAWLDGPDAEERAGLVASLLFGVVLARDVLGVGPLDRGDRDALARHLGPALQHLIDGGARA